MEVADALGLGLFTISGVSLALVAGMPGATAERVVGHPIPTSVGPRRPGDPTSLVASGARAAAERAVALGGPRLAAYQATWRATQAPGDPR